MQHTDLATYYTEKYRGESSGTLVEEHDLNGPPGNRFAACAKYLLENCRGGDVLEIAAGSGSLAYTLFNNGFDCRRYTLTELSPSRLAGLRAAFSDPRVEVLPLDVERVPEELYGRFDVIVMLALIEHLVNPLGAMAQVRKMLKPDGFVFIETPNIAKYSRRIKLLFGRFPSTATFNEGLTTYEGEPVDLHDEGHLHYFTFRSIDAMLTQRCGFSRVDRVPYFWGLPRPNRVGHWLAQTLPTMFSDVSIVARA